MGPYAMPEAMEEAVEDASPRRSTSGLGVALDAVTAGQQGVSWGFQIAKSATQLGFGAANAALRFTGEVGGPGAQVLTGGVEQVLNFAHGCTSFGQAMLACHRHILYTLIC